MGIIDKIKGNPFEKLKKDDLTAERIRLEREEKLKIGEVERLSKQKKELFDRGFEASEGERRSLARQIKQLDQKVKLAGLMSKLAKMPKSKLDEFLAEVNIKDQVTTGSIQGILTTMEAEHRLTGEIAEDAETGKLMDIWETSDITESDEIYKKLDREKGEKEQLDELAVISRKPEWNT